MPAASDAAQTSVPPGTGDEQGPRGYHGLAGFLKGVGNPLFHEAAHKNAPSGLTWGSPPSGPGEVRTSPSRRRR